LFSPEEQVEHCNLSLDNDLEIFVLDQY